MTCQHGYGHQWRVEGVFSALKRIFGEHFTAKKYVNMAKEILLKAALYNFLTQLTAKCYAKTP